MIDIKKEVLNLQKSIADIFLIINVDDLTLEIENLEKESQSPDLWKDAKKGSKLMRALASKKSKLASITSIKRSLEDYTDLIKESSKEDMEQLHNLIEGDIDNIKEKIHQIEKELQFSGKYDEFDALMTISSGAGGVDAQDWASMILRMYLRWTDKKKFKSELLSLSSGEEAGIKSALLRISGETAFGWLRGEKGVHRLVRLSPFNSANLRHTSFALVEVIPDFQESEDVEIDNDDLKIEAFKARGAGGQSVQKNSSAIRITHNPSGIVVSVQNERSQSQNKNIAFQILRSKLIDLEIQKTQEKKRELKGEFVSAEWGNQVRSYVLHPYTLVKDMRTNFEMSDVNAVLDGEIDDLLVEFLKFSNNFKNK